MKLIYFVSLFLLLFNPLYAQDPRDYIVVNELIEQMEPRLEKWSPGFLINHTMNSKYYHEEGQNPNEIIEHYFEGLQDLFKDTLQHFQQVITKEKMIESFVTWKKSKINYQLKVDHEVQKFFYFTKPIFLDDKLFVIIDFDTCPGGGYGTALYKYDQVSGSVKLIRRNTLGSDGLHFR